MSLLNNKSAPVLTVMPTVENMRENVKKLEQYIHKTPIIPWVGRGKDTHLNTETEVVFKAELFQKNGHI